MSTIIEHGKYYFSFFTTELKTTKKITELFPNGKMDLFSTVEISNDEKISYVHEFVHFIQDISTLYGLKKLTVEYNKARYLYNTSDKEIKLPYRFQSNEEIFMRYNNDLFSLSRNETKSVKLPNYHCKVLISEKNAKEEFVLDEKIPGDYSYFEVELDYDSKKYGPFSFGGHCISECMAKGIETHLFPQPPKAFDSDYDLPFIVAKNIYPEVFSEIKFTVALCDASLFFDFPGQIFLETVQYMKKEKVEIKYSYEIYSLVWKLYGGSTFVFNRWILTVNEAINSIGTIVNVDEPEFNEPCEWAKKLVRTYCYERMKNTAFFTNIMEETQENAKKYFTNLIYTYGSPLCYTQDFEFFLMDQKEPVQNSNFIAYWWKLKEMFNLCFNSFNMGCPFSCICTIGNATCRKSPWKKKSGDVCDYNLFSRCFGLYKRVISNS